MEERTKTLVFIAKSRVVDCILYHDIWLSSSSYVEYHYHYMDCDIEIRTIKLAYRKFDLTQFICKLIGCGEVDNLTEN